MLLQSGCSSLIALSGVDLAALKTQEEVRAKFGNPLNNGVSNGESFDTFCSRSKFRDAQGACGDLMFFGMTMGLSEFFMVPIELYQLGQATLRAHEVRFTYNALGRVTGAYVVGKSVGEVPTEEFSWVAAFVECRAAEMREKKAEAEAGAAADRPRD